MKIRLKLFALVRERAGRDELTLDLPEGATVADAASALADQLPAVRLATARAAFAVNRAYVQVGTVLQEGDELAIIPPVSGG